MIAVDTNILVYAFRPELPFHDRAKMLLDGLLTNPTECAICWPCVHEFLATVTNPKKFKPAATAIDALRVFDLLQGRSVRFLSEAADHLDRLRRLVIDGDVKGGTVHDARIAAICLSHGVSELWTADRDFVHFPALHSRNPLVDDSV